jgi:hypothetical protein
MMDSFEKSQIETFPYRWKDGKDGSRDGKMEVEMERRRWKRWKKMEKMERWMEIL